MISFFVNSIMMLALVLSSFYVFTKSIQHTATMSRKILTVAWCLLWSFLYAYAAGSSLIPLSVIRPLACLAAIIFIFFITGQKFEIVVSAYLLSFGISCFLNYIATFIVSFVYAVLIGGEQVVNAIDAPLDYNQPIYLILHTLIFIFQLVLSVLFFRIRRFKKGFPFIFKKFAIVAALFFTGIILILVTWVNMLAKSEDNVYAGYYLFIAGVLIAGIGIYILIRRLIKAFQRKRVQQNTENYFEKLWLESEEKIKRLNGLNKGLSAITHNFTDRIKSMEDAFKQGNVTLEDIQNLQKDWQDQLSKIKGKKPLPSTKIKVIDNLFEHFAKQFSDENITFNVMVNGSIVYMADHIIKPGKLETVIVNHLKDAQIAVNASNNPFRSVMVVIGLAGDYYEFTVFDSGIPFKVDTLARLGTGRVTTHADNGGSGIGFETTFETMRECNASLIINEQEPSSADYSKSVSIRFDGKNQYIIKTYRPDDFLASDRYIVAGH